MDSHLAVDSATGLEINLAVAGPGARSYAFVIDWHIRVILGAAWWVCAVYFLTGSLTSTGLSGLKYFLIAVLPAAAIALLYHPVLEILMHGRTPGKRIAGVRIVTREGLTPDIGPLLIRNVFRLVDSLPVAYCVGLGCCMFTRDQVRIGDLAAGTLLVYDRNDGRSAKLDFSPELFAGKISPQLAELIDDLLARWSSLNKETRTQLAHKLLQRVDSTLEPSTRQSALRQQLRDALK